MFRSTLRSIVTAAFAVSVVTLGVPRQADAQTPAEIEAALKAAYAKYQNLKEGKSADYIPALAKVDPNLFGIALDTPEP